MAARPFPARVGAAADHHLSATDSLGPLSASRDGIVEQFAAYHRRLAAIGPFEPKVRDAAQCTNVGSLELQPSGAPHLSGYFNVCQSFAK
ncbi:MAG: hypothetical protein ROR55_01715 [Devosia sp.]